MNKLKNISLKYKLLFLLIILPMTFLTAYLGIAVHLFKKDKIAYVFDSSLTVVRSISAQIRSEITYMINITRPIVGNYQFADNKFSVISRNIFNAEDSLRAFTLILTNANGKVIQGEVLTKGEVKIDLSLEELKMMKEEVQVNQISINPHKNSGLYYFAYQFSNESSDPSQVDIMVIGLFQSDGLGKVFEEQGSFSHYLINENGKFILGGGIKNPSSPLKESDLMSTPILQKIKEKKLEEGTEEIVIGGHTPILLSFNQVHFGNLMILTVVKKDDAFSALNILLLKSILFFFSLISLSVIVSIFASHSLTSRIRNLSQAVHEISEGNFHIQVTVDSGDEVGQLSLGFNSMAQKIAKLLDELKDYSENLERMVDTRTKELKQANDFIKTMIDSLGQGLLVFNEQGECLPIYTKACDELFMEKPKDKKIWDVMKLTGEKLTTFQNWVATLFKNLIPFQDMSKLGPTQLETSEDRHITLEYKPMEDDAQNLIGVVTVATDKSAEFLAKQEAKKNQEYSQMIIKIVKNKKQFVNFISEARTLINHMKVEIHNCQQKVREQGSQWVSTLNLEKIGLLLHTLKGGSGLYSMTLLKVLVHDIETGLTPYKKLLATVKENNQHEKTLVEYLPQLAQDVSSIEKTFETYIADFALFLGEAVVDGKYRLEVRYEELSNYAQYLSKIGKTNPLYQQFVNGFLREPIINFFSGFNDMIQEGAAKQNKQMNPLIFQGGEVKIDGVYYMEVLNNMVHIFNNIIDHALETPEVRQEKGRALAGTVKVIFSYLTEEDAPIGSAAKKIKIAVMDDGKGIDPQVIRQKLRKNGVPENKIEKDDALVIQHIFDDSFSTAEQITLTSGRGVGMGAVKSSVEKLGGSIFIISKVNQGTTTEIILPLT